MRKVRNTINKESLRTLIHTEEKRYKTVIQEVVQEIIDRDVAVILVCGPSGSGKTTTAYNIRKELQGEGKKSYYLSMDNWYKSRNRNDIPMLDCGRIDYEHPESLDLKCLHDDIESLIQGKETSIPTFNFKTNEMEYNGLSLQMEEGSILIIEGIHAFNEKLKIDGEMYKVYIEPEGILIEGRELTGRSLRVIRRIIRDKEHRNTSPEETIEREPLVSAGEELYIYPSKLNGVDKEINSFMLYELYLYNENNKEAYEKVRELSGVESKICVKEIPKGSILEEFYI